jgi:AcrR family transcriptional regulator
VPPRRRGRPGYDVGSLVDKAVEVFTVKGFDGTSMEDLSRSLGISKSAIYHHVTSKDELLEFAIGRALDGLAKIVEENRRLATSAIEQIEHLIRRSVHVLIAQKPSVTLLLRVRGNSDVERRALERRRAFDRYTANLVVDAVQEGSVRPDTDPALTARLIFGMVSSLTEWVRPVTDTEERALADAICAMAFDGIRTRRS